jgi:hypothetical protein
MNDKLLTLLMGKKWHERSSNTQRYRKPSPCACGKQYTAMKNLKKHFTSVNPDYSRPADLYEFFTWLCKERPEMWFTFRHFAFKVWIKDMDATAEFIPWLFFQSPSRPRDLMAEWLRLDETVERWGWTPCDGFPECMQGERDVCKYPDMRCEGNGKTRGQYAPWARLVQEAKP